jgi:F-type H+-transporting ATPase subunit delta
MDETPKHATVFDADQQHIGDVYAKALLSVGKDTGKVDELVEQLDGFVVAVNSLPKLKSALESPRVAVADKESMIQKAVGGKVSNDLLNFLKVLGRKGRFDCLNAVNGSARKMHDEMAGRAQATLTTASPVDDSVVSGIASKLEKILGKKVSLQASVDPEIIGGMVVRVGDTVYDGSVANQLKQVRAKAIKAASDSIRSSLDKFAIDTN